MAVLPAGAFAACPIAIANVTSANAAEWFGCLITNFLNMIVWPIFITVAIVMFIWAGILFLTAHGEPEKISMARKAVIWACIGIVVGLLGYVIVGVLRGALGL